MTTKRLNKLIDVLTTIVDTSVLASSLSRKQIDSILSFHRKESLTLINIILKEVNQRLKKKQNYDKF